MKDLFKRTMTDIEMYSEVLKRMANRAVELGLNPDDLTVQRAFLKTDGALRQHIQHERKAQSLGYSSVAIALKALGQMKDCVTNADLSLIPEVFHKVPMVWLRGRPADKKRKEKGFAPMTPGQAKLKHRLLLPLLIRVWSEIAEDEALQNELIEAYLTTSANSFEIDLFAYDEKIEDYCIDETEYIEEPSIAELIRARQAATVGIDSYGVGAGELIAPDWNEGEEKG
jgi:hypothetical protein